MLLLYINHSEFYSYNSFIYLLHTTFCLVLIYDIYLLNLLCYYFYYYKIMIQTHNTHKQVRTHSLARSKRKYIYFFLYTCIVYWYQYLKPLCTHSTLSITIACARRVCESSDFPQGLILQYNYLSTNSPTYKHTNTHTDIDIYTHTHYIP